MNLKSHIPGKSQTSSPKLETRNSNLVFTTTSSRTGRTRNENRESRDFSRGRGSERGRQGTAGTRGGASAFCDAPGSGLEGATSGIQVREYLKSRTSSTTGRGLCFARLLSGGRGRRCGRCARRSSHPSSQRPSATPCGTAASRGRSSVYRCSRAASPVGGAVRGRKARRCERSSVCQRPHRACPVTGAVARIPPGVRSGRAVAMPAPAGSGLDRAWIGFALSQPRRLWPSLFGPPFLRPVVRAGEFVPCVRRRRSSCVGRPRVRASPPCSCRRDSARVRLAEAVRASARRETGLARADRPESFGASFVTVSRPGPGVALDRTFQPSPATFEAGSGRPGPSGGRAFRVRVRTGRPQNGRVGRRTNSGPISSRSGPALAVRPGIRRRGHRAEGLPGCRARLVAGPAQDARRPSTRSAASAGRASGTTRIQSAVPQAGQDGEGPGLSLIQAVSTHLAALSRIR